VTIGNVEGRAFTGLHGNGALAADGNPDGAAWPAPATGIGAGFRGGDWLGNVADMRVSDRRFAFNDIGDRFSYHGGRGARLAP
jgi:hypothetical protein